MAKNTKKNAKPHSKGLIREIEALGVPVVNLIVIKMCCYITCLWYP